MDSTQRRRYSRQIRLSEIGTDGQAKLCSARVSIHPRDGITRTIEERYIRFAGMQPADELPTVEPSAVDRLADVAALGLRHASARDVAEGALRALAALRLALGEPSPHE